MRKFKKNVATAMIAAMSLSVLPAQIWGTTVSAAPTKKVAVKKTETTVTSNKALKKALQKKNVNKIVLNTASAKNFRVPKGNYKDKTLVINASDKSKVYIPKGAKFKRIIYLGAVKNASLVIDEAGNKIELASKTTLSISGKAAYAELIYNKGAESAKVTSKIELVVENKTKKPVKFAVLDKKITVKAGETYANTDLEVEDDETAQGAANFNKDDDSKKDETNVKDGTESTAGNTESTGGGAVSGGYTGGSTSGGGTTPTGGSGNTATTPAKEADKIVNSDKTKVIDATSFLRYVVVSLKDGYKLGDVNVNVDGTDITGELTPVDTEGTLYKWEVSTLNPSEVTVTSKDKKVTQTVKLARPKDAGNVEKPELKGKNRAAKYIVGYATIPVWDYHLDNFDDEGNRRKTIKASTFSSNFKATKKIGERLYYTEPAELGKEVEIQFNYKDEADKKWFDAIPEQGGLELVEDDEAQKPIKVPGGLAYTKKKRKHHGSDVAVLAIQTGTQPNFSIAGYYRLRIKSNENNSVMVRFKVEEVKKPEILLGEVSLQSGKNIHFKVENVSSRPGKSQVERAELVMPTGETRTLRHISDYIFLGNEFILYNDVIADKNGINNTRYNGKYVLKVYFREYKSAEIGFIISQGEDYVEENNKATANKVTVMGSKAELFGVDGMKFDAIAGASRVSRTKPGTSGGGSDDGISGTPSMSADLMFNVDLLANAEIFDKLKINNDYATEIVDRFEKDIVRCLSVYDETSGKNYNWLYYNTAVNEAKNLGKYLSFADYIKTGDAKVIERKKKAKEVLEDNLLGALDYGDTFGKVSTELSYKKDVVAGEGLEVTGDPDFLSKIVKLSPNRDKNLPYTYTMQPKHYSISENKLSIKPEGIIGSGSVKYGELEIFVIADGYQNQTIKINIIKKEDDKSGQNSKPDDSKDKGDKPSPNPNQGSGTTPEQPKNPNTGNSGSETNPNGQPQDDSKLISLKMPETFKLPTGDDDKFMIDKDFLGKDMEEVTKQWLGKVTKVSVNGTEYKEVKYSLMTSLKENQFAKEDSIIGNKLHIHRPTERTAGYTLEIVADGYKTYVFTLDNSKAAVDITKGEEKKAVTPSVPNNAEEEAKKQKEAEEAAKQKQAEEEAKKQKEAEEAAKQKQAEEEAKKKQAEEEAKKQKEAEEEAKKKQEEDSKLISLTMPETFKLPTGDDFKFMIDKDFLGKDMEEVTKQWLGKVTKVSVNGTEYKEVKYSFMTSLKENQFAKEDSIIGNKLHIHRPTERTAGYTLEIVADGYKTYVFTLDNSQSAVAITKGEEKKAVTPSVPNNAEDEAKKQKEAEEAAKQKQAEEEKARQQREAEEAAKQKQAEEEAKKQKEAEEAAKQKQAEEEAKKQKEAEEARKAAEAKRIADEEAARLKAEEEAKNERYPYTKIEWNESTKKWNLYLNKETAEMYKNDSSAYVRINGVPQNDRYTKENGYISFSDISGFNKRENKLSIKLGSRYVICYILKTGNKLSIKR